MERLSIDEVIAHCNRQTRDYERLNGKAELENADISLNFIKQYWEHRQVAEWLRELKTYKDAEKQGLLLRLPCPIGSTVWFVGNEFINDYEVRRYTVDETGIDYIQIAKEIEGKDYWNSFSIDDIGKTVFLTKEEAEQALEAMKGGAEC